MADIARLTEIIEPEAKALGFDLVRVKMMPSEAGDGTQALQIMAEDPATGQLVIEQCAELSRAVSAKIDALEEQGDVLIEGAYHLEVSSPGIDRPLTRLKDFATFEGYEAKLETNQPIDGRKRWKGVLAGVESGDAGDEVACDNLSKVKAAYTDELKALEGLGRSAELAAAAPG